MRNNTQPIQVFEHEFLEIAGDFKTEHWEALDDYNEKHGGQFFRITHKGVRFNQYVGAIQVGDITIEVLPKIGKGSDKINEADWQRILIDMLQECGKLRIYSHEKASLQYKHNSILEAYLLIYIKECERLIRAGLIKKYRLEDSNCNVLKGKLLFSKNIQKNLVHQEQFFTRHQVYDRENIYNQILLKALKLIPEICQSPFLKDRVYSLLLSFPELADIKVTEDTFQRLVFDRKTASYREAMEIAAMLLLNYRPDISHGHNNVLAILFDMNKLWEEYIYIQIERYSPEHWDILPKDYKYIWQQQRTKEQKGVEPDMVIRSGRHCSSGSIDTIIIDTKWKLPDYDIPADDDLKQMFVYNEFWKGFNALLLYPNLKFLKEPKAEAGNFMGKHSCDVLKMSVIEEDTSKIELDTTIGERINKFIENLFVKKNAAKPTR